MAKLLSKNYTNRADLEVAALVSDPLKDVIEGTRDELGRLQLSDQTTVYGIKCIITDSPTEIKPQVEKPERGELHPHSIK